MVNVTLDLNNFEYFLLIMVRISAFVVAAPVFGNKAIPSKQKIGLSFFVTVILYGVVPHTELVYESVVGYAVYVVKEGITGLIIGYAASICNSILMLAGNVIDMDIGLSMATEFNPEINNEVTITGNFYYYIVLILLMISDMHSYILRAACDSFYVVPVGGAEFAWDHLLTVMIKYMTDLFVIGFRIFLPVFACIMILNVILGIMAKVAPQMNMFSVGIQLKVLVGLGVLMFTTFMISDVANFIYKEMKNLIVLVIEGMY